MNLPKFVAVGHKGSRLTSADGLEWKLEATGKEGEIYRALAFGNGRFAAVGSYGGDNIFASSADGVNWQTSKRDARYSAYLRGLGFGNSLFLALGGDPGSVGSSNPIATTSADGVTWSDIKPIAGKHILRRMAFGNGRFVGVGDRGRRAWSGDGFRWTDVPDVKAADALVDVAFGANRFVGVGLHGLRITSDDGQAWRDRQAGEEGEHLNSIVWAGDRFVAVGMGATYESADGSSWTKHANRDAPLFATFGHGWFLGSHWKGRILASTDAIAWKQVFRCEHHIEAIAAVSPT